MSFLCPFKCTSAGSTLPGALGVCIKAEALQCDSHLPANSSVILHSQPGMRAGKPGADSQAPLHLQLQVRQKLDLYPDADATSACNSCCKNVGHQAIYVCRCP